MRRIRYLLAFIGVTVLSSTAMARSYTVEVLKASNRIMSASFFNSTIECNHSSLQLVDIQWAEFKQTVNGVSQTFMNAFVAINILDGCSGENFTLSGFAADPHISMRSDLGTAHFDGVFQVATDPDQPGTQKSATVTLNVNFTATGPLTKTINRSRTMDAGTIILDDFTTNSRTAKAVGTLSGMIPIGNATPFMNLISAPSFTGSLANNVSGTITIIHKTR